MTVESLIDRLESTPLLLWSCCCDLRGCAVCCRMASAWTSPTPGVLKGYLGAFNFKQIDLLTALRKLLNSFKLPGEVPDSPQCCQD